MSERLRTVEAAIADLRRIRAELRHVGASAAADYVQRAIKSAEGARRHAQRLDNEARAGEARP